jgi:N-acetylmuramoyl-L-alanine amidase
MVIEQLIQNNRSGRKIKELRGIIVHWTANLKKGADADAHFRYFNSGYRGASAHYFVDSKKILRFIPEDEVAWHVGDRPRFPNLPIRNKILKPGERPNDYFIGIEMCVNEDGNWPSTVEKTKWLVRDIMERTGLTIDQVYRHYDITGKDCPKMYLPIAIGGKNYEWSWQEFKNLITQSLLT